MAKYYSAAQISQLSMLHATSDISLWVLLELPNCTPISLEVLLWLPQITSHNTKPFNAS